MLRNDSSDILNISNISILELGHMDIHDVFIHDKDRELTLITYSNICKLYKKIPLEKFKIELQTMFIIAKIVDDYHHHKTHYYNKLLEQVYLMQLFINKYSVSKIKQYYKHNKAVIYKIKSTKDLSHLNVKLDILVDLERALKQLNASEDN